MIAGWFYTSDEIIHINKVHLLCKHKPWIREAVVPAIGRLKAAFGAVVDGSGYLDRHVRQHKAVQSNGDPRSDRGSQEQS